MPTPEKSPPAFKLLGLSGVAKGDVFSAKSTVLPALMTAPATITITAVRERGISVELSWMGIPLGTKRIME